MTARAPIALQGVRKAFGPLVAVDGVDLTVPRGELFGLIGHNGAGKSTLFRIMLGLTPADAGEVQVAGCAVGSPAWQAARARIGYLPEQLALYDNLNAVETLTFFAQLKRADASQIEPLLARVGLSAAAGRPVRTYSKGMRQRLGLAQALLGTPQVLFLDEPTNGLDPQAIREFYELLDGLRRQGVTVIITSHILAELQQRVDRLAILASGRIVAQGSVQELREALALPLTVSLWGEPSVLAAAQTAVGDCATAQQDGAGLHLRCERVHKMEVLARLAPLASQLADLQIHEPSLEDLYFGVAA
ncbi:ABC transporter ATP-binding protein [Inhella gelatinilytica]|uniref:ABC transporter ATP-binding protein n=1 Tax=Inhella gelatinilytica TaxID=2795030 RepID=A0A931IX68_9BURK|nr:ABC transporter ATP-binding protein [Inhella gelatinilytica]MBH9552298.1 ABC transporter ATP-binding protein [Inhella gelatinilytica]